MARRLYTSMTLFLVMFVTVIVHRTEGYPHERSDGIRKSKRSSTITNDKKGNGPVPSCRNLTYCTETPYYPSDYVDSILSMNESFKYLATIDVPSAISLRDDEDDEKALCTSTEEVVRPKTALSIDERWLYIVNSENYMQRVRVEICQSRNTVCGMIDGFAEGYKTTCRQTYVYRQLVAIGSEGAIMTELFKIPASCKCYIKFTGDPSIRLGVNLRRINKTPVPKKRIY